MENLKELLDAEQEKVTKLKALIIKERKVNTKMKAELEHLKSQHTADNQCSSKSVERVDKSCCTSEYSNAATSTNTTQTTDFDVLSELPYTSNKDFQEKRHENIPTIYSPSNTHKVLNSINNKIVSPCMIESSSFCDDKVCSTGKNLQMSCVKQLTIAPDDDFPTHLQNSSVDCHGEQCSSILKQFNLALKSLKLHEKNILSKGELESVFDECKKMVEKSDWCSSSIEDLMADSLSFKSKINVSEDHCQGIQVPPNNHLSSCESRDMLLSCHCLHPSKDAQTITDAVCDELSVLEERVDGLKSWVERAEFSLNNLSNKLTSATYINERNDTKLCQLQATCFGSSDACELPSLQNTKTALIYDSFLVPLTEYYQEISNKHCELDVNHYISNSFENAHIDEKNIEMFLNKLKHIIKHYFESNVNAQNGQLTASLGARISDENENTDSQQNKLFLDKIKSIEYELSKANERAAISESVVTDLKEQIQNSEEKLHLMKNLLVKAKLDSAEQQKKIVELQKSQTVNVEYTEELNLSEELSHIKKVKENLESTVAKLSSELTQQHALYESLLNEKRLTVDRFQKLQTEHAAYKIKAQHALCNARTHKNEVDSLCVNNNDSSGKQDDETIVNSRSSVESEGYFLTELEFVKKNLSDVQHRKEEAELHASLAQSECNLLKKELTDFKAKYNELICQSQKQKQTLENKILSLMQQHEDHLHNELKELEKKYTSQLSDYEERLMLQTQKHENELRQEREFWEAKLARINRTNELSMTDSSKFEQMSGHRRNFSIPDHFTTSNVNLNYRRDQGDGADNTNDETQTTPDQTANNYSLSRSGSETNSLIDADSYKTPPQITIPTLEQLLNRPNQYSSFENSYSPQNQTKSFREVRSVQLNQLTGLQSTLASQQRRVECLSEMLSESETNLARLFAQNKLLKEEVRRLETNRNCSIKLQEADNQDTDQLNSSVNNNNNSHRNNIPLEHLKNILLKIITLSKQSSERSHLMHALVMFLSLKSDECKLLEEGLNENVKCSSHSTYDQYQSTTSWSSYISTVWRK